MLDKRFSIKTTIVGGGKKEEKEVRVLNRVIRHTSNGWEYEADQRHADIIVKELGLEEAKAVASAGEDAKVHEEEGNLVPLSARGSTQYRKLAARANYLAPDRPDVQYAVKELCRNMAAPKTGDWRKLKRLGRYLVGRPRLVHKYRWQAQMDELEGFSDSDWAGCRVTGKSTSGSLLMKGSHFIKSWSRTLQCVTLSSAEAELVAMTKLIAELIGLRQLSHEWGHPMMGRVFADSTAALAIAKRKGCGKLRHINVGLLWVQEKKAQDVLDFMKVEGKQNPADMMTKHIGPATLDELSQLIGYTWPDGRARSSLAVKS